jgi:hypothetical protein
MTASRTAILHLGTYKTGSSSIQNLLHGNRARLAAAGILYPKAGLIPDDEIGHRHRNLILRFMRGDTNSYVMAALRRELAAAAQDTVILSNESWSHPRHLPMLGGFAAELADLGLTRIRGVVFLRRLIDYKVSHYREFTWNQGNRLPFGAYILGTPGMFDYLFLIRAFRAVFGPDLAVLDYARIGDSADAFLGAAGFADLRAGLEPVARANILPIGALEIEAVRQANAAGLKPGRARAFLAYLKAGQPELFAGDWTERTAPLRPFMGAQYRRELAGLLGWPAADVEALLEDRPTLGRPVTEAAEPIRASLRLWQETAGGADSPGRGPENGARDDPDESPDAA